MTAVTTPTPAPAAPCPMCGYLEQMPISLTAAGLLLGIRPLYVRGLACRLGLPPRYRRRGRNCRRHRVFVLEDLRQLAHALARTNPSLWPDARAREGP
jgi:hypothetical protein